MVFVRKLDLVSILVRGRGSKKFKVHKKKLERKKENEKFYGKPSFVKINSIILL